MTDQALASDVAIVGGGPGGSATAISLLTYAPTLSVTVIETSHFATPRIGESLPPAAHSLLEHLNTWDSFKALGPRESFGTTAVWGQSLPLDNEFIFMPAATGWQLDRAAFDSMLISEARKRGANVMLGTSLRSAQETAAGWRLSLSTGSQLSAKFVVDATGGSASFARRAGARFLAFDRLVGISRSFACSAGDSRLLVESFADGWWYTAGLPDGKRITCCVTDADLAQQLKLNDAGVWYEKLGQTRIVATVTSVEKPHDQVAIRSTNSRLLSPIVGKGWLAVGDAASRFDPLSSQGIVKALRSGIFASYAIGDWLLRKDDTGLRRYQHCVKREFSSYRQTQAKYYRQEQRWPTNEFWRRRHTEADV